MRVLLVGQLLRFGGGRLDVVDLLLERGEGRFFLGRERDGVAAKLTQAIGVAVGEVGCDLDPLPAFGADGDARLVELFGDHHVDQADILQPAAVVTLEQVVQDRAAGLDIGIDTDELGALVRCPDRALGQHPPDGVGLLVVGLAQPLEHLLLALMIAVNGERHQLVERHAVLGVDVEQLGADRGEPQALLDHRDRDELVRRNLLLGLPPPAQREESPELVERVKRGPLDVLGEAVFLGETVGPHDTGDGRGLGETTLLHQQRERPITAAAGRDFEHAGLLAGFVDDGPDTQAHK
jgi:hypothetical protein